MGRIGSAGSSADGEGRGPRWEVDAMGLPTASSEARTGQWAC